MSSDSENETYECEKCRVPDEDDPLLKCTNCEIILCYDCYDRFDHFNVSMFKFVSECKHKKNQLNHQI